MVPVFHGPIPTVLLGRGPRKHLGRGLLAALGVGPGRRRSDFRTSLKLAPFGRHRLVVGLGDLGDDFIRCPYPFEDICVPAFELGFGSLALLAWAPSAFA